MPKFSFTVRETLSYAVEIEAENREEAEGEAQAIDVTTDKRASFNGVVEREVCFDDDDEDEGE